MCNPMVDASYSKTRLNSLKTKFVILQIAITLQTFPSHHLKFALIALANQVSARPNFHFVHMYKVNALSAKRTRFFYPVLLIPKLLY